MENEMPVTARTILMEYLEELEEKDLKKFTFLLKDYPMKEGYSQIPGGQLEKADCFTIADQMINHCPDEYALEIAGNLLYKIPRLDLYDKFKYAFQKHMDKNPKLQNIRVRHLKENYMRCMKEKFRTFQDKNGRIGENISLKERYTKLLIVKEHPLQAEREHEIMSSGRKYLEIMDQRAGHSYSSVAALFEPEKDGHVPRTVVLQGAAGIGKTVTAQKIMLDWASGELFQDRFDYVFYINCREINQLSGQQTMVDHLLHTYPWMSPVMSEIEADPDKLLFIIDGFDELSSSIDLITGDPCRETQKDNIIMSFIGKQFIFQPYILITTRPTALGKLQKQVVSARFAEILGFSEDDRKEYFTKFFKDETQGAQTFNIVKENDILFTMCFVPIVCWIVCTVIKLQMEKKEDPVYALRTMTSVYMLFLSNLLKQQSRDSVQPIHMNLKTLCALAKEGVCLQKILFEEKDLIKYGLAIPAVQSLFLKNDIFQKDTECENCYSFIHLSFQEFFAAMFYVLRENEASRDRPHCKRRRISNQTADNTENPQRAVKSLLEASRTQKHFMLTVRFLFGLLNKETLSQMENRFQWEISPEIKPALLQWIKGEMKQDFSDINNEQMELFHCLYEIQEEEFVTSGTGYLKHIGVSSSSLRREINAMDFRALGFCLKNSPAVEGVYISNTEMRPEDLRALTPGLMTCSRIRMWDCSLTASCCADIFSILTKNSSLKELNLSANELLDSGARKLCAGVKQPGCKIQTLVLERCSLTASCCADLSSVVRTNSSLTQLDLSANKLMDSGVRELCPGLKHPGCTIHKLVLWDCSLTASCCADLASLLSGNSSLTELYLGDNELMDSGVIELCEGLKHSDCRIQTLGLNSTGLTDTCTEALRSALCTNHTLQFLNLSENSFTERSEAALRELQDSSRIQRLDLKRAAVNSIYWL